MRSLSELAGGLMLAFFTLSSYAAVPAPPTDVRPAWVDAISTVLTWEDSQEADSFNVYRFDSTSQSWTLVGTQLTLTFFREAPSQEPPFSYAVTAVNAEGESLATTITIDNGGWSDFFVTFYDPNWYPWLNGPTSATIQVAASPVSGVDAVLEFGTSAETAQFLEYRPDYVGFHSFTVTNLTPATAYFYRITLTGTNRLGMSFGNWFYSLPPNSPPEAFAVDYSMWEDAGVAGFPWNGYDPDGYMPPTARIVTPPAHGTAFVDPNDLFSLYYQPAADFSGTDSFTYVLNDGSDDSAPATVTITIYPLNDAGINETPALQITVPEDTTAAGSVLISDVEGDAHTLEVSVAPPFGNVQIDGTNFVYEATLPNFHGLVTFALGAVDGNGLPANGLTWVEVNISSVNDVPTVQGLTADVLEDTVQYFYFPVSDLDNDPVTYHIVAAPEHGTIEIAAPYIIYTPALNYNGAERFTFKVNDGQADSALAEVNLNVLPVDDMPVAELQEISIMEDTPTDLVIEAEDVDGGPLAWGVLTAPVHGTLAGTPPNLHYIPPPNFTGSDSFTFRTGWDEWTYTEAEVRITIVPVDDSPMAVPQDITTAEDSAVAITLAATDIDGGELIWAVVTPPANGSLSGTAPNLTYTPGPNFSGSDGFTFSAANGQSASQASVGIQVTAVNDAPIAINQNVSTAYNTPMPIVLTSSDSDSGALTFQLLSNPANGTLNGVAPNLTFTPNIGWFGVTAFTFRANDGQLSSAPGTVTITVQDTPTTPAAPTGLTASAISSSQINLSWSDNSNNEDGFKIERSTAGGSYVQVGTVGPNSSTFSSAGLTANKTYSYRVRAHNVRGNSAYSDIASAKTKK